MSNRKRNLQSSYNNNNYRNNDNVISKEIEQDDASEKFKHAEKLKKQDAEFKKLNNTIVEKWQEVINGRLVQKKRNKLGSVSSTDLGRAPEGLKNGKVLRD